MWLLCSFSVPATISMFHLIFFICVLLSASRCMCLGSTSWLPHNFLRHTNQQFLQKTDRFWEFQEETNSWVEVQLPYDLLSCVNGNCTKVALIDRKTITREVHTESRYDAHESLIKNYRDGEWPEENSDIVLSQRKRISLTKVSETSIWVTGESGSIYERFWNGLQWVIAPHDLPISAGPAISVFVVNQTILALSEVGSLYQMQLSESSQPVWVDYIPTLSQSMHQEADQSPAIQIKSAVVSHDAGGVYFCTKNGLLLELTEVEPPRWVHHGRPPGAYVAGIADAASIKTEVIYIISSMGDLYEYERSSKPPWKKHIWKDETAQDNSLTPLPGCGSHGLKGDHSISLFLLTKGGHLVERQLNKRKWKWIIHGRPKDHHLTSITPAMQDELNENFFSLFFTSSTGSVFEYRMPKHSGTVQENQHHEPWLNHMHPPHAKVARGIAGQQFQVGRIFFPLDDGRIAELHSSGLGGENSGPIKSGNHRRKASIKYVWSILDAPETEGWNAEYCTEERGPTNCIMGTKDGPNDQGNRRSMTRRRRGNPAQEDYLSLGVSGVRMKESLKEYSFPDNWINKHYHLRMMHGGRSFFLITDNGLTFEYLYTENVWLWLRHDHSTAIKGALGSYNGSLFLVDTYGTLLIRERRKDDLVWINCTAMKKGKQINGGPPWDVLPGKIMKVTAEDALFFVSKNGRLLQFTVALRKFKWKDCHNPPNTKVACIIDQELFRENVVFIIGMNGRLYQYNKVTGLWHEHHQSQHLILSRLPGTAMRPSLQSLTGSLFVLSEGGGLVEYHWNTWDGWNWVEHGTPAKNVTLVSPPGPWFQVNQLFLVGSDGNVYLRYMDQMMWRWKNFGFPNLGNMLIEDQKQVGNRYRDEVCIDKDFAASLEKEPEKLRDTNTNCDSKVASTRPIPFSEESVIFELRDGRLAEMQQIEETQWIWSRIIGTPTSSCIANYWTALAS